MMSIEPVSLTAAIAGAYGLLNDPIIRRVLEHAADAASGQAGTQALMAGAKLLKKQLGRVMNSVKAQFGADTAQKLETLQGAPNAQPQVIQAIFQAVQASPPVESEELANLLEEIQALREETEKLSKQMQTNQVQVNQTHTGTGNNVNIQAIGGGDAFGGDKVMGNKIVRNP